MKVSRRSILKGLGMAGWLLAPPFRGFAEEKAPLSRGRFKQALCWGCFQREGVTPQRLIQEAKRVGYQGFDMPPREQWDAIREAGMRISIIVGHGTLTEGLNDPKNHSRIEEELLKNIDLAVQYEIPALICFSGNRRGRSDQEGLENTVKGLQRVVKVAEEKKVTLCVELLNSKVDHPDYQCDHTSWGVEMCRRVNSPAVKLLYDIYHMQIMEGDLIRTIRNNIRYIAHFHTAGNPGRRDLDEHQEIYYPAVMRAIAETGFSGFVAHEFVPKEDPIRALRKTYELCSV